jgi:ketosteroid isomerase-like protein
MTEYETRDLCTRFFDAYQDGRLDVLDEILADDCIIWHNVFGKETTKQDNLTAYPNSYNGQRRRLYNDRQINAFEDGFVIQYTLHGTMNSGHKAGMPICIVGRCADGKITRIDEYMDTTKFAAWGGARA